MMIVDTWVLYCEELADRQKATRAHLEERGVQARWWQSIYGKGWGLQTTREYEPGECISSGHVGLNLGHWNLWNHLLHTMDHWSGRALILEDDVVVPKNWQAILLDLQGQLHTVFPEWQLCMVGLAENEPQVWNKVTERIGPPDSRLCRLNDPFGTHAYLVRHSALPILIKHMAVAERNMDQQLFQRVLKPGLLNWCAVLPTLVRQRTFDHDKTGKPEWAPSCVDLPPTTPVPGPRQVIEMSAFVLEKAARESYDSKSELEPNSQAMRQTLAYARSGSWPKGEEICHQTPETIAATLAYTDPYPCIYRGEQMTGYASHNGVTIPLTQCARLNQPCHSKTGQFPEKIVSCETCKLRLEMASADRARLPLPDGHFNPSMIMFEGRLILATRDSWGHSRVALWQLNNTKEDWTGEWGVKGISSLASSHPDAPRLEDPRLFVAHHKEQPRLHAAFNLPDGYPPKVVRVGYVRFSRDLGTIEETVVFPSPQGNAYEKNWVPFEDGPDYPLRWVYATKPEHVVMTMGRSGVLGSWRTPNPLPWTGGVVRGGATPVWVKGAGARPVYYHFFHGCLKQARGNIYTTGLAVFEAKPPFRVLRQTPVPLIWPDLPAPGEDVVKRFVVWPGGAVPHAGAWFICLGIDDTFCRIVRLPFDKVEAALDEDPESGPEIISIRETEIAKGVQVT